MPYCIVIRHSRRRRLLRGTRIPKRRHSHANTGEDVIIYPFVNAAQSYIVSILVATTSRGKITGIRMRGSAIWPLWRKEVLASIPVGKSWKADFIHFGGSKFLYAATTHSNYQIKFWYWFFFYALFIWLQCELLYIPRYPFLRFFCCSPIVVIGGDRNSATEYIAEGLS